MGEVLWSKESIFVWNGLKGSKWAQKGPKWSKTLRLAILVPLGPFWATLTSWQGCHIWPFLVQNGPFLGHPQSWTVDPKVKKWLASRSPICGLIVEPQSFPFRIKVWPQYMKNVKKRSKFHEKTAVSCHYLTMNGKLWFWNNFSIHI